MYFLWFQYSRWQKGSAKNLKSSLGSGGNAPPSPPYQSGIINFYTNRLYLFRGGETRTHGPGGRSVFKTACIAANVLLYFYALSKFSLNKLFHLLIISCLCFLPFLLISNPQFGHLIISLWKHPPQSFVYQICLSNSASSIKHIGHGSSSFTFSSFLLENPTGFEPAKQVFCRDRV